MTMLSTTRLWSSYENLRSDSRFTAMRSPSAARGASSAMIVRMMLLSCKNLLRAVDAEHLSDTNAHKPFGLTRSELG
jgi:hypothetical protein